MGNRLSKIYTRTGDDGSTGLADGSRVDKDSLRMEAIGSLDELNSGIGLLLVEVHEDGMRECLLDIQHRLFDLGGELSLPGTSVLNQARVDALEQQLDTWNEALPPLREFILPGGGLAGATAHIVRTVCRRAERRLFSLSHQASVNPVSLSWLNRLSDLLFVIARRLAAANDAPETFWDSKRTEK